jgi:hypothetical protein
VLTELTSDANSTSILNQFLHQLKANVNNLVEQTKKCRIYVIASVLDPRLKLDFFEDGNFNWTESDRNVVVEELSNLYTYYAEALGTETASSSASATAGSVALPTATPEVEAAGDGTNLFYKRRKVSVKQEWEVYLNTPISSVDKQDPLSWWKEHSTSYPVLAELIKHVFAIPASMAYAEMNLNQGIDMIARFRRHRALFEHKREPLPVQHQAIASPSASATADDMVFAADERSVEEILCLQSWSGAVIPDE